MLATQKFILAADWAAAGTITVSYPTGIEASQLSPADHKISVLNGAMLLQGRDFALTTVNKLTAVFTLAAGMATIVAGSTLFVEFHLKGNRQDVDPNNIAASNGLAILGNVVSKREVIEVNFGAPATIVTTAVAAAQNRTGAGALLINGTLSNGALATSVATLDVPRNLIIASGGADTAVLTITGKDVYNNTMIESITLNGATPVAGKKAFKTITGIQSSATITNSAFVGTGDVLGFPIFLPNSVNVLYDTENDATITDGTYVAGVLTKPTATTGDVRGTYDPNSACDGAKRFSVVMLCDDPMYLGVPQYIG